MNTQHTPGPWDWYENSGRAYLATPDRGRLYVMAFKRHGMHGATVRFSHWDGITGGTPRGRSGGVMVDGVLLNDGELHPDARLIAAAPDLLDALQRLLYAARSNNEGGTPKTQGQIFAEAGHAAIAAILKATGEEAV